MDKLKKAEKTALRLIARAEQCSIGLSRKLEKRGYDTADISEIISLLCEQNLIDDSRYAQSWLKSRLRLTRTPRRLLISLCSKGIPHKDAEAALIAVLDEETELAMLARFVKKHSRKTKNKQEADSRMLKFLLKNEGFSLQAIESYLEEETKT